MKTKVVTISVEATVAGSKLSVSGATITLGVNAIPSIELQCAPTIGSNTALEPNVIKPKIADFSDLYKTLAEKAEGLSETGDVTIKVMDDEGKTDSLNIKKWVLAGVGLSSVGATSAPYLSVILQHPICNLTKVGSIYETPKSTADKKLNEATASATDFLDVVTKVYQCMRENVEYWPSPDKYVHEFTTHLGVGDFDPKKWLTSGDQSGIFLGQDSKAKERLAQATGRFAIPDSSGSSTWDMLIKASGSLLLSITQNEQNNFTTDQLVLEPTQPWKQQSLELSDDKCFWTELPGMNPFRITGVMARKLGPYCDALSLGIMRNGNMKEDDKAVPGEVLYVPVPCENLDLSDGRIIKTTAPAILDSAFRRDAPYGGEITTGMIDMDKERKNGYNEALKKYCKAVFEITAGSMVHAKAQMALGFKDNGGKLILPGNTCKFVSDGTDIYYGYVINVVHHLSTGGGCSTTVAMSYVRSGADFKIGSQTAIAAGSKNAAYE